MEILFTECSIVSVLPADWSKSPDWGCCTPTGFFNLYNNWSNFPIFAVVTPI